MSAGLPSTRGKASPWAGVGLLSWSVPPVLAGRRGPAAFPRLVGDGARAARGGLGRDHLQGSGPGTSPRSAGPQRREEAQEQEAPSVEGHYPHVRVVALIACGTRALPGAAVGP
jgi:hypothetical protein